ncbi:MAG TPA: chromosome segregation protein SMC [Chthoniobacterales bacterium]|jgi:chromosome segregation protein
MHLQSLELFGFKSFADKTIFSFHEGVTAVVGPNGCGKSNILDAVRWVLGEQSAKSLRGGEMADVIFNGTDSRKPLGFAEVSLTFTDCAAELGVDWHDVRVTRRVHRDGISEYFLNRTGCRLKDIHSLFADTGVGRTAYSIMEQGKIDLILSSRPEDRRSVFEEAAGITKYKTQKKEALHKLEATEANLLRIGDIIKEVKRQIGSLQRQAGKARRYQALHADLKVLDTHFSHRKLRTLQEELAHCTTEIERLTETEREMRGEIEAGEAKLTELRNKLDAADDHIASERANLQRIESGIAAHQSRIEFNEQRGIELNELITRSKREIATAETKLREHETEIDSANAAVEETGRNLQEQKEQLEEITRLTGSYRDARQKSDEQLHEVQMNLSKDELRLSTTTDDLQELRARRDATGHDADTLVAKIGSADSVYQQLQATLQSARLAAEQEQETVEQLFTRVRASEDDLRVQQTALADMEKQVIAVHRAIAEIESRLEVLRQLNEEGEGLAKGSQALLKTETFALAGALAAQLSVPDEFVAAVEAALGRNLHAIVLRDRKRAAEVISFLNGQQLGQAALVWEREGAGEKEATRPLPDGAIGWAVDKVTAPASLAPLIARLLHNVAIFSNLESALALVATNPRLTFSTLSGEFFSGDGVLFGGKGKAGTDSLLRRKATIDSIATELENRRRERAAIEQTRQRMEAHIASLATALEQSRSMHRESHLAQTASAAKISEVEREHYSAGRDLEILRSEHATLERQIAVADGRIQELEEQRRILEENIATQRAELERLEHECGVARRREEEGAARLAELRIGVATQEQKHQALLAQRAPMLARQKELAELIATRGSEIRNYEARLLAQAAESESAQNAIALQTAELTRRETEIAQFITERETQSETINAQEVQLRGARHRLSELQEKRGTFSVRQTQLQLQSEHLAEHVSQRYQIDLRQFAPDSYAHEKVLRAQLKRTETDSLNDEDIQKLITELARQLDSMGPVNLEAVQEYDELEERFRFLESQNNDLTNSRRELLDVIARINVTTQKLFAETFAQVRMNFREMFGELFGGGRADLQLMDENDALNCGIEIIAKPPGKQLQSISLLSGGERTMTAVALLFAIYMVRPSPFCVLDEMDAPLDESNINRFIRVLERFVRQSQFIIITHNKRTIAKADVLYGVTMEERGVSKLVGMKMTAPRPAGANNPIAPVSEQRQFPMSEPEREPRLAGRG